MNVVSTATGVIVPENPNSGMAELKRAGFSNIYMQEKLPAFHFERLDLAVMK